MSCPTCGNNIPLYYTNPLQPCVAAEGDTTDAAKIIYTSTDLACLGVAAGDNLQSILQAIDGVVCSTSAVAWNTFDYGCLTDGGHVVNSAKTFSERISSLYCSLKASYDTFTGTTYVNNNTTLNTAISAINLPSFPASCGAIGVLTGDTMKQAVQKVITNLCTVNGAINPSGANWNTCYTVSPAPTTIVDGFNTLISQICGIKTTLDALSVALPLFDNTGTCLASPTTTDSLYQTVVKIRTLLCTLPTFAIDDITWNSCIPKVGSTLTSALNTMYTALLSTYNKRVVTWDNTYFVTTYDNISDPCSGLKVSFNAGAASGLVDKKVSLDASGTAGYLLQKIGAGDGVSFDTVTTPGKVIISSDSNDHKVLAGGSDTPDFLYNKIVGSADTASILNITTPLNMAGDAIQITPAIDYAALTGRVLSELSSNDDLHTLFDILVCAAQPCPSPATTYGQIYAKITNSMSDAVTVAVTYSQLSPSLAWYSANMIIAPSAIVNTGSFYVTSASNPVTGIISIKNNNSSGSIDYSVHIEDTLGNTLAGASTPSGTLTPGSTFTLNPITYGHSITNYLIVINITTPS